MKTHLYIIIALVALFSSAPLYAADTTTATTTTTTTTTTTKVPTAAEITVKKKAADDALTAYKQAKSADKLAKLQALGEKLIDTRLASLNQLLDMIAKRKGLTAAQITALNASVQKDIDSLTTLKATIASDTTVDKAKSDVKSIFDNYRIYAVFMPKIHITVAIQQAQAQLDKLNLLTAKLQAVIDAKKAASLDTTTLTTALADYKVQLADATKQLGVATSQLDKMIVSDVSASKTAVTVAHDALKIVRADFVAARGDLTAFKDGMTAAATTNSSTTTKTTPSTSTKSTTSTTTTTP